MCDKIVCPYKDKCISYPYRCSTCKHNIGKRDYYKPDDSWKEKQYDHWTWSTEGNTNTDVISSDIPVSY